MLPHGPWWKGHLKLVWLVEFLDESLPAKSNLAMNISQYVDSTLSGVRVTTKAQSQTKRNAHGSFAVSTHRPLCHFVNVRRQNASQICSVGLHDMQFCETLHRQNMELAVSLTAVNTFPEVRLSQTEFAEFYLAETEPSQNYSIRVPQVVPFAYINSALGNIGSTFHVSQLTFDNRKFFVQTILDRLVDMIDSSCINKLQNGNTVGFP
jgi:hypothetical protein